MNVKCASTSPKRKRDMALYRSCLALSGMRYKEISSWAELYRYGVYGDMKGNHYIRPSYLHFLHTSLL